MDSYHQAPISNGNPDEQALIRQWWHEEQGGRGLIVWEYYIGGCYVDAVWFSDHAEHGREEPGAKAHTRFPITGQSIVLCEAKIRLTPELIGQALVYQTFAKRAGAEVGRTIILARSGSQELRMAARDLGLEVILQDQAAPSAV